jgi:hypothetical protein
MRRRVSVAPMLWAWCGWAAVVMAFLLRERL